MEPLLKSKFSQRLVTTILLVLLGLTLALGIHVFSREQAIGKQPQTPQSICANTSNLSPEKLNAAGRASYEQGRFDIAIDCWKKAYRQMNNETEQNQTRINLAQAEQALGLYPRACNTLISIYGEDNCAELLKDENKSRSFFDTLSEKVKDNDTKIAGLHSLGNVLRELGELEFSHQVLMLITQEIQLDNQPQKQAAVWLDLANTTRALSYKEQDLYKRSQERENIICAAVNAYTSQNIYQKVANDFGSNLDTRSLIPLQAKINELSLILDIKNLHEQLKEDFQYDVVNRYFEQVHILALKPVVNNCLNKVNISKNDQNLSVIEITDWVSRIIRNSNPSIQLQHINEIQQQIEQLSPNNTTLYTRLNFAKNLLRIQGIDLFSTIKSFLEATIIQAKNQNNFRVESYALGYLGQLYKARQDNESWEQAIFYTRQALSLAESIAAPDVAYQWQWQLGQIYESKLSSTEQANNKNLQDNLNAARSAYEGAFKTLESLRRDLATARPEAQLSFLNDIENIYRQYVNLLLQDEEPTQDLLSQARQVIASLQAVELENFLRQACPENKLEDIDRIIQQQSPNTAFVYPIVLKDRIVTILKLPGNLELKYFRQSLESRQEFEQLLRSFQINLEEEYTFKPVLQEGKELYELLVKDIDQYIERYNSQNEVKIDTLVFALDTDLRGIPLAALVVDNASESPQYFIDKYAIALASRLQIRDPQAFQGKKLNVLAAGVRRTQLKGLEDKFPELRFVEKELKTITNINSERIAVAQLLNKNFNENEFKQTINSSVFQVLHLATHGEFSSSPENTFILASDTKIKVNQIDSLFRGQAQNQLEPIEMLVMSACETAAGDKQATLGMSGVAVQAGARSAIASLWTLDDEISVDFTRKLYEQLVIPNLTKAKALQEAQKQLKNLPGRQHPRYWAPYILLGNWL